MNLLLYLGERSSSGHMGLFVLNYLFTSMYLYISDFVCSIDKPGTPEGPLEVTDVMADSCKLSWKPPADNGGAEVTGTASIVF